MNEVKRKQQAPTLPAMPAVINKTLGPNSPTLPSIKKPTSIIPNTRSAFLSDLLNDLSREQIVEVLHNLTLKFNSVKLCRELIKKWREENQFPNKFTY